VESSHPETLQLLLKDDLIRGSRVVPTANAENGVKTYGLTATKAPTKNGLVIPGVPKDDVGTNGTSAKPSDADLFTAVVGVEAGESILQTI
jgi:DNA excision repair protein ERCC-3